MESGMENQESQEAVAPSASAPTASLSPGSLSPGVHDPAALPPAPVYAGPHTEPARGRNINGLVLNFLMPGLGSLICGRIGSGLAMVALVLAGIVCFFALPSWAKLAGFLPIAAGWIWSITAGIGLLNEREPQTRDHEL